MTCFDLRDKIVWLTGASSGIGEALTRELVKRGAKVAITARRADVLEALRAAVVEGSDAIRCFPGDVEDLAQMKKIVDSIESTFGEIDLAIPNAGTHIFTIPESFNSEEYLGLMRLNFGGMLHCIEAVLPRMLARGRGYIAPVASLAGYRGLPRAARIICGGIERQKREIAFPFPFSWVLKVARILPAPVYERIVNQCW